MYAQLRFRHDGAKQCDTVHGAMNLFNESNHTSYTWDSVCQLVKPTLHTQRPSAHRDMLLQACIASTALTAGIASG